MWGHNGAVCFNYRDIKIPTTELWWTLEILPHGHNLSYLTKSVPVSSEILLQVQFEKSKSNVRASPVVVISRVNLVVEKGHHFTLHGWEVLSTEEFLLELLATAGPAFTWHQILAGSWVRRSGGYYSFVFIVQEGGGRGEGGGVQSHHHNLNALDAQTPPLRPEMMRKYFHLMRQQRHVWAVSLASQISIWWDLPGRTGQLI